MSLARAPVTIEKRAHSRAPVAVAVVCERNGAPPLPGTARDIGIGGMFVEAQELPVFGTALTVILTLPGTTAELRLPAVVRWVKSTGFGVQFGLLGARETYAISRLRR